MASLRTTDADTTNSAAQKARKDRNFRRFILITGSIVVLLMTYGSGMRAQTKRIRVLDERRKVMEQDIRQAQRSLILRRAVIAQLEGRRQVSLALGELDRRNFGTAQEHVTEAARLLDEADKAGTTAPDLNAVRDTLKQTTLTAAADVATPREALLSIASQMDTALNNYTGEFLRTSTSEDAAHPIKPPTMNDVPNPNGHSIMPGR